MPTISWPEIRVTSWQGFIGAIEPCLDAYKGHVPPVYVFRGQADADCPLEPALSRHLRFVADPVVGRQIEELLETEFIAQASSFPEAQGVWTALASAGRAERWAFMQHHGCPTRLLDWTSSAYVAAYFSVCDFEGRDGALFVVGAAALDKYWTTSRAGVDITDDDLIDPTSAERVVFTWPQLRPQRLTVQQGHFSVNTKILSSHGEYICTACAAISSANPSAVVYRKIVIAKELKLVMLQQLRSMNIAPHALFPTIDGLGRSLVDLTRLKVALALGTA